MTAVVRADKRSCQNVAKTQKSTTVRGSSGESRFKGPARLFLTGELRPELSSKHEETCAGSPETRLCDDHHSSGPWPESNSPLCSFHSRGQAEYQASLRNHIVARRSSGSKQSGRSGSAERRPACGRLDGCTGLARDIASCRNCREKSHECCCTIYLG